MVFGLVLEVQAGSNVESAVGCGKDILCADAAIRQTGFHREAVGKVLTQRDPLCSTPVGNEAFLFALLSFCGEDEAGKAMLCYNLNVLKKLRHQERPCVKVSHCFFVPEMCLAKKPKIGVKITRA